MGTNSNYLLQNLNYEIPVCHWLMYLDNFLGKEKSEEFYEYLIQARQIIRKNDIRTVISTVSLSVYSLSPNEQLAFVGIYNPINRNNPIIQRMTNGFVKAQELYRNKNKLLSNKIKKLGYSFTTITGNWKDITERNTYQRERIFIIFSEKENPEKFKQDICNLVKKYNINTVLITDKLGDNKPKMKIKSNLVDVKTGKVLESYLDTTIEIIEKYFTNLHNIQCLLKLPYEKNKKILTLDENVCWEYYTPKKQELVKNSSVNSFNIGIHKQSLLNTFSNINYNN